MNDGQISVPERERSRAAAKTESGDGAVRRATSSASRPRGTVDRTERGIRTKRRKRRRRLSALACFLLATAAGGWWWYAHRVPAEAEAAVATAAVQRRDFSASVLATGAVQPRVGAEVRVGARLSGKVERLYANIGDRVAKGQVVAELEQADLEALVAQRRAELDLAQAKLAAVESLLPMEIEKARLDVEESHATYTLAQKQLDRVGVLIQKRAASEDEMDETDQRYTAAKARLAASKQALELAEAGFAEESRQAKAEIDRAQSALRNAQIQLSYATITAPIDGVIASVSTEEGETVAAGMQAPTFVTIIDLRRLQVDAYVDEVDIGKVKVGQDALFTVDAFPGREFQGRVTAIYPKAVIQDNVVNYDVVVEILDEYEGVLRPEMTASVTILLERRTNVLAIPAKAVKRQQGKNAVYLASDGEPALREITVGWKDDSWIEVVAGLAEGDTVFLETPTPPAANPAP